MLVRTPMYGLLLSQLDQRIRSVFQLVRNNMLLPMTNSEVHAKKYLDRSFEVRTERSEVRTKSYIRSQYFPVWTELIGQ